jgi:uncharacterized protein with HEPN domain
MLDAARQAAAFVAGRARDDLDTDHMLRRALKDCVQEIGEAASRVSDEGRARAPGLPWKQIVGMRHRIVHVYYDIDADALWTVAVRDLPVLEAALEAALNAWPDERGGDRGNPVP